MPEPERYDDDRALAQVLAPPDVAGLSIEDVDVAAEIDPTWPADWMEPESKAQVERARGWEVDSEDRAQWAMGQLAAAQADVAAIEAQAVAWQERIAAWKADAERKAKGRAAFMEQALLGYLHRRYDADPKVRTLHLPAGTLKVTVPKSGSVQVEDEGELISWLESDSGAEHLPAGDIIKRPEPSVLVSELRKHVKAVQLGDGTWVALVPGTGETPPGAVAAPPKDPTFRVEPG